MKSGLISVVLPIYNVEKYLDRCVNSIVCQTYKDLEIILVDDGSSDRCPEKCDEWAKKDERIRVIHKKNAGLGYARNTGIENASGEYICFFDSDDFIKEDTIEKVYAIAREHNCDIVLFGHYEVNEQGKIIETYIPESKNQIYEGSEIQNQFLPNLISDDPVTGECSNLRMSAWSSLYSMQMILKYDWKFVSEREIISEDVYSLLRLYKYVNKIGIISEAFYFHCENVLSLTHIYEENRFHRLKQFYFDCLDVCEELEYNEQIRQRLVYPFISYTIATMKMIVAADMDKKEKKRILKNIIDDKVIQNMLDDLELSKEKKTRKIFLILIKKKMYDCCYILLKIKVKAKTLGIKSE